MAGAMLRTVALLLRGLQFIFTLICMAIFSYFLAVLAHFHLRVLPKWQATESICVIAFVYTLMALALVLCLAGSKIFGFIAIFFDLLMIAGFIAVAWFTRHGAYQCNGLVQTPVGDGLSQDGAFGITNTSNYRPRLGTACRLNRTVFALSIILIFLFLATAILQVLMSRSKKDKRYVSNEKDYNNTTRSSKTPLWKRNQRTRSRSSSRRRSHRDKDLAVAGAGVGAGTAPVASRGITGRRSGDSGSTLSDNAYNRAPKHHESGLDRPGHTPITAPNATHGHGHHNRNAPIEDVTYLARNDGTYLARDDGTYPTDPNAPIHSVTVHSPTTITTTTTHLPTNPVSTRNSSRGRRGQPEYTQGDSHGHTHVPGHNVPLTQQTPYHEITSTEDRHREEQNILRNQSAAVGQPGYGQNIVGGQRDYDNTTRGQNILPGQTGHGLNTIGNQRDYNNTARGQPGYDQNIIPGQTGYGRDVVGNQRDYDNTTRGQTEYGRDSTFRNSRDVTPGRVRDITPGRDTVRGQNDYDRSNLANQREYDNSRGQTGYNTNTNQGYNTNTNQGYNDNYNRDPSFNRTPSAGRVRRF